MPSIGENAKCSHELSAKLESLSSINEALVIDVEFSPSFIEPLVQIFLSIGLWKVIPLHDNIRSSLLGVLLGQDIEATWLSSLVSSWFRILVKN